VGGAWARREEKRREAGRGSVKPEGGACNIPLGLIGLIAYLYH
jgi:hypothetical protein